MEKIIESMRARKFRLSLAKGIPKFPNDKQTLQELHNMSLSQILIHHFNWAARYVFPRPRTIKIEPSASTDPRWNIHKNGIDAFLIKVRQGDDLTAHLSLQVHSRGYTPTASAIGPHTNRWADKDFLLNVMGFHHFHLGTATEAKGHVSRTDTVLFGQATRDEFHVIGLFDHSVFESGNSSVITPERERLWNLYNDWISRDAPPNTVLVTNPIATSGHPLFLTFLASDYAHVIRNVDPQLDNRTYVDQFYKTAGHPAPTKPKFRWKLNHMSLGLLEDTLRTFHVLRHGPF